MKSDKAKLLEENKQINFLKQELSRSEQKERDQSEELKAAQFKYDKDIKYLAFTKNK